jgi:hypothetical protein
VLVYDGQGFWLATKRLSKGRFRWWPQMTEGAEEPARALRAHQAQVLLAAGNPDIDAAPVWRKVSCVLPARLLKLGFLLGQEAADRGSADFKLAGDLGFAAALLVQFLGFDGFVNNRWRAAEALAALPGMS